MMIICKESLKSRKKFLQDFLKDNYLANEGGEPDDIINRVSEESDKDVALSVDLACVNLIE